MQDLNMNDNIGSQSIVERDISNGSSGVNNGTIDNRKTINNFHLSNKEKEKKNKKEHANRYGLRKIIEDGKGGVLLPGAALINLKHNQKVKGKEPHKTLINVHTLNGEYLTDHTHIPVSSLNHIKKDCEDNEITSLLYVNFMGRPYNYNDERYDGLSIKVGKKDGGFITIPPQTFTHNEAYEYFMLDTEKDEHIDVINGMTKFLHGLNIEEYIGYIDYFKSYINYLTRTGMVEDFIFDYILYSYFLEVSHKSLYTNEINWRELDYNYMIDIIVLLASTVYEIQKSDNVHIPTLMQSIGYKLCAIQEVYDTSDYNNNPKFKKFEQFINKLDSWETVKYRIKNLELKYQEMRLYDDIYLEGYSVINERLEDICFHIYKNKPA